MKKRKELGSRGDELKGTRRELGSRGDEKRAWVERAREESLVREGKRRTKIGSRGQEKRAWMRSRGREESLQGLQSW